VAEDLNLAFIASEAPWFSRWTSFMRDHLQPEDLADVIAERRTAFDRPWSVLVGGVGSALLDASLVADIHERQRAVIAVYDPDELGSKQKALALGVDDVIEATASTPELMEKARTVAPRAHADNQPRRRRPVAASPIRRAGQLVAIGGPVGADPEPVALGMARTLGRRGESTLLVDGNEVCPSVAQLLGLSPVPNLASVVAAYRASTDMDAHLQHGDGYYVIGGLAEPGQWADVSARSVLAVVTSFAARFERTVVTMGPLAESSGTRFGTTRALATEADSLVVVGDGSPVGMTRLAAYIADLRSVAPTTPLYLAAGNGPGDRFRQRELLAMMGDLGDPEDCVVLPRDDRLGRANWQGTVLRRGPLVRSVANLADSVAPKKSRKRR
jgi:Mrp family chromosome partitioning ATPase